MNNNNAKKKVGRTIDDIMAYAAIYLDLPQETDISVSLECVVKSMIPNNSIEDLWGSGWSLFLATVAGRITPSLDKDVAVSAISKVLRRMTGDADISPITILSVKAGVGVEDIYLILDDIELRPEWTAEVSVRVCEELGIPTPLEVSNMSDTLGESATPYDMMELYKFKPDGCKYISEDNIPGMLVKLVKSVKDKSGDIERSYLISQTELKSSQDECARVTDTLREVEDERDKIRSCLYLIKTELHKYNLSDSNSVGETYPDPNTVEW